MRWSSYRIGDPRFISGSLYNATPMMPIFHFLHLCPQILILGCQIGNIDKPGIERLLKRFPFSFDSIESCADRGKLRLEVRALGA
jgi:hypothetical protein